jgi:uncharacterized protein (DUF885 family)
MQTSHFEAAQRYFDYVADRFPVMCASDEFHFLPRAQAASRRYDKLENLEAGCIDGCIARLKAFRSEFDRSARCACNMEEQIDFELLKASASGILIELETNRSWRFNPLLYLKIAFIGLDHALTKPADTPRERLERAASRLDAIPRLFEQAKENLKHVPASYHRAARAMVCDCIDYLSEIEKTANNGNSKRLMEGLKTAGLATASLGRFLEKISPAPVQRSTVSLLKTTLTEYFLCNRSLDEIFTIAVDEWNETLRRLTKLGSELDSGKSWQQLYHAFFPGEVENTDTGLLYRREIEKIRLFFAKHGFKETDLHSPLVFSETPTYLRSVRGTASFTSAFTRDVKEKSIFYLTTRLEGKNSEKTAGLMKKRLHREYKFLTAHEAVPGHHLLDTIRRGLENPVRRQIESPLFYEGWATYAESLLAEYGYVKNPFEVLVDYKRRLWRCARCQIDVGLPTGFLKRKEAERLLITSGFSLAEAKRQIDRFQLNPGYQICYSLGRHEIMGLKARYSSLTRKRGFHEFLLEGGELPFHFVEKRFEAFTQRTKKSSN